MAKCGFEKIKKSMKMKVWAKSLIFQINMYILPQKYENSRAPLIVTILTIKTSENIQN